MKYFYFYIMIEMIITNIVDNHDGIFLKYSVEESSIFPSVSDALDSELSDAFDANYLSQCY